MRLNSVCHLFEPHTHVSATLCHVLPFTVNCATWPSVIRRSWLGSRKGIRPVKNWVVRCGVVICLEQGADLHMAQLMPLPLTVSCFSKIQIGFTFLVPAHPSSPGKRAVKWVCVCVCVRAQPKVWIFTYRRTREIPPAGPAGCDAIGCCLQVQHYCSSGVI